MSKKNKKRNRNNETVKNSNILDIKSRDYGECGWCKDSDNVAKLKIEWSLWCTWLFINSKMDNLEWTGVYDVVDEVITNFRLPRQVVKGTECEMLEDLGGNGVVHSHHNMGAFHSGQDDKHCRNLYTYSLVLSNSNGYDGSMRRILPCGGFGHSELELEFINAPSIDLSCIQEYQWHDFSCAKQDEFEFNNPSTEVYETEDDDFVYIPDAGYVNKSDLSRSEKDTLEYMGY